MFGRVMETPIEIDRGVLFISFCCCLLLLFVVVDVMSDERLFEREDLSLRCQLARLTHFILFLPLLVV